jgi:hypothetical protein
MPDSLQGIRSRETSADDWEKILSKFQRQYVLSLISEVDSTISEVDSTVASMTKNSRGSKLQCPDHGQTISYGSINLENVRTFGHSQTVRDVSHVV